MDLRDKNFLIKFFQIKKEDFFLLEKIKNNDFDSIYYKKIKLKSCGEKRILYSPISNLKKFQRILLEFILEKYWDFKIERKIKEVSFGFQKGKSTLDAVNPHLNKKILIKIDLNSYFKNFSKKKIFLFFYEEMKFNKKISEFFTRICIYKNELPQGSPTSPILSNLISKNLDISILNYLEYLNKILDFEISYTRYVDDLFFSFDFEDIFFAKIFSSKIFSIIKKENFSVNYKKFEILKNKNSQKILGIFVNNKFSLGRENFKKLKAIIFNIKKNGWQKEYEKRLELGNKAKNLKKFKQIIKGNIGYFKMIYGKKINF